MDLRERITRDLKEAMKERDTERLSTLRLISAAIKDKDIELRGGGDEGGVSTADIHAILSKMVKQRQESARAYEEAGRLELAEKEQQEIQIISRFLPKPLSEDEVEAAIDAAIASVQAASIRDMGRVMGELKSRYNGRMDFAQVGPAVKARFA